LKGILVCLEKTEKVPHDTLLIRKGLRVVGGKEEKRLGDICEEGRGNT